MFLAAEENPAPESWTNIALGLMLQAENAAIDGDVYRGAVCDSAYRDPEVWGDYSPGFSAAVVIGAIREARLQGALPSPGGFIRLCIERRRQFKIWNSDLGDLMQVRYHAEDELDLPVEDEDSEWDSVPGSASVALPPAHPRMSSEPKRAASSGMAWSGPAVLCYTRLSVGAGNGGMNLRSREPSKRWRLVWWGSSFGDWDSSIGRPRIRNRPLKVA